MARDVCTTVDFKNAGRYMGREWVKLQEKVGRCKGKVRRFRSATGEGFDEVKRGRLFNSSGEQVFYGYPKDKRAMHDFVTKEGRFAMTLTSFNYLKRVLVPFKITTRK